jgi:hypothetical protein
MMLNRFIPFAALTAIAGAAFAPNAGAYAAISAYAGHPGDQSKTYCFSESWGTVKNNGTDSNCNSAGYGNANWGPFWEVPLPVTSPSTSGTIAITPTLNVQSGLNSGFPTCFVAALDQWGNISQWTNNVQGTSCEQVFGPQSCPINFPTLHVPIPGYAFGGCYMNEGQVLYSATY